MVLGAASPSAGVACEGAAVPSKIRMKPNDEMMLAISLSKFSPVELSFCLVMAALHR